MRLIGMQMTRANNVRLARSLATPLWAWSGVVCRETVGAPPSKLAEILDLLPCRLSSVAQIIRALQNLGHRFFDDLTQVEYGPTRAERRAGLSALIESIDHVKATLSALSPAARRRLSEALASFPEAGPKPPLYGLAAFDAEKQALETLSLAADDVGRGWPSHRDPRDFQSIDRLSATCEGAMTLSQSLDTTTDIDLALRPAPRSVEAEASNDDDLARLGAAIGRLKIRLKAELVRLSSIKGPDARISLLNLVAGLWALWVRETRRPVTVNPNRMTAYAGAPQSEAGVFIAKAVEALAPTAFTLEARMRAVGRPSAPYLKSQLNWSSQAVHSTMRLIQRRHRDAEAAGKRGGEGKSN
jgi:hypothetical protein